MAGTARNGHDLGMAWHPKNWKSLASGGTPDELRARICPCFYCTRDGQHAAMCFIHDEENPRCNCPLSERPGAPASSTAPEGTVPPAAHQAPRGSRRGRRA